MTDESQKTREELLEENESLKQEVAHYKRNAKVRNWTFKRLFSFGRTVFLGRNLDDGLKKWLAAAKTGNLVPTEETANVLAAIIRRSMGFYIFAALGAFGALSTPFFIVWQNNLFRQQITQQAEQDTLTRRAQLIQVLYDKTCVNEIQKQENDSGEVEEVTMEVCTPISDARSRAEAAKVFISLERDAGVGSPDLSRSLLSSADFFGADLRGTNLRNAVLSDTILGGANLTKTNLFEANLSGADLTTANLFGANLFEANLSEASLSRANLGEVNLTRADLREAVLGEANLSGAVLDEADITKAELFGVDLSEASLFRSNLTEVNLIGASLFEAEFIEANFLIANLKGADLTSANFTRAKLISANLTEADLSGANFAEANLTRAGLSGTTLTGANLNGAILQRATYNSRTVFPESFKIPEGMCLLEDGNPNNCFR